jgi:hypothetical protein
MFRWPSLIGAVALLLSSLGTATAASISEDIVISYFGNTSFNLSNLSFSGPSLTNIFAASIYATPGGKIVPAGTGTLLSEVVSLDTSQSYTVSFTAGATHENALITPSELSQGVGTFASSGLKLYSASVSVSPVPLPASFPLFILALISLVAFGYHTRRKTIRFAT